MKINIRQEEKSDHEEVFYLIKNSFQNEEYSDNSEHFLVQRLRNSSSFIPELSLVAETQDEIAGYILLTRIKISGKESKSESLALAPVAVLPKFQKQGIGAELIKKAHEIARNLGFTSIILLGHEHYYPRFGYQLLESFDINMPFEAPKENCMAVELIVGALSDVEGTVEYPKEFFEE